MEEEWFKRGRGAGVLGTLLLIICVMFLLAAPGLEPVVQENSSVSVGIAAPSKSVGPQEDPRPIEMAAEARPSNSSLTKADIPPQDVESAEETVPVDDRVDARPKIPFEDIIHEAAKRYGVDPALIRAIIMAESGYNPKAVSKRGAKGLMQLMPATAQELGVVEPFDPVHNIHGGVKYFRRLLDRFNGDIKLALAAYNAGSTKVRRHKGIPPIRATRYYINKVFRYYKIYKREMNPGTDDA